MFFLNTKIEYFILDYDYLVNPEMYIDILSSKGNVYISVLSNELTSEDERDLQERYNLVAVYREDSGTLGGLDGFFRDRPWTFNDIFVTSDIDRVAVANSVAVGTVLIEDAPQVQTMKTGCDLILNFEGFENLISRGFRVGNLGELIIEDAKDLVPGDRAHKWDLNLMGFGTEHPEFDKAYALGRFLASEDPFLKIHLYSRFIKVFKVVPQRFRNQTAVLMDYAFKRIASQENLGTNYTIAYVPKKPNDSFDRNRIMLENLRIDKGFVYTDGLKCVRQYDTQKEVRGSQAKRDNVRGAFAATMSFKGMSVVLLDDVYTSGATLAECAKVLGEAGAVRVVPVALGLFCPANPPALLTLTCDKCGSHLDIQFGTTSGRPLWGCKNYKQGGHSNYGYAEGVRRLRKMWADAEDDRDGF